MLATLPILWAYLQQMTLESAFKILFTILGLVWFSFLKLGFLKKWEFQKVQYKTEFFFKKLSVWLILIKVTI